MKRARMMVPLTGLKNLKNRPALAAAALLLFLIVAYFLSAIIRPSETLYSAHSDLINYVSKLHHIELMSFSANHNIPLWNPYSLLGNSLVGNVLSWLFYPFNLPYLVSSSPLITTLNFVVHIFLLGFFTYLFVRKISGNQTAAIFSSVAMVFTGKVLLFPYDGYIFFLAFAYFPLLLLLAEMTIEKRSTAHAVLFAIVLTLQFLGLHMQLFFYSMVALALYIIFRLLVEYRKKGGAGIAKPALLLGTAFVIFLTLSAFQMLPLLESLRLSDRSAVESDFAQTYRFSPLNFITIILPNLLGTPLHDTEFGPPNYWEQNAYFGITALILAGLAAIHMFKKDKHVMFFTLFAVFCFFFSLGYANHLPGFSFFRIPSRMLYFCAFAIAVLCGYGAAMVSKSRMREVKAVYALPLLFICMLVLTAGFIALKHDATSFLEKSINSRLESGQISKATADNYLGKTETIYQDIKNDLIKAIAFLALSATAIILALKAERKTLRTAMLGIILLILVADLWTFGRPFFGTASPDKVFAKDEIIGALEADPGTYRVFDFSNRSNIYSAIALMHGVNLITYDTQNLNSEIRYLATTFGVEQRNYNAETKLEPESIRNPNLISLLNVKYMITDRPITTPNTTLVTKSGQKHLYRNNNYEGMAFVAHNVMPVDSENEIFKRLEDSSIDYSRTILIQAQSDKVLSRAESGKDTTSITLNSPNRITVTASIDSQGFLFLSEGYAPGWKATVDGKETRIYKANGAFMGVFFNEGTHEIEFSYMPGSFLMGTAISAAALLAILCYFFAIAYLRKKGGLSKSTTKKA